MWKIVDKRFAEADGQALELEEFEKRWPDRAPARTWSSKAVFFPHTEATQLSVTGRYLNFVSSLDPVGVWMCGGHHWLCLALDEIRAAKADV